MNNKIYTTTPTSQTKGKKLILLKVIKHII